MKRRKFIKGVAGVSASAVIGTSSASIIGTDRENSPRRVHGIPLYNDPDYEWSEIDKITLALNSAKVPKDLWEDIKNYRVAWESLRLNPESRALLRENPQEWLEAYRIPSDTIDVRDVEFRLMHTFFSNPELQDSLCDYRKFCKILKEEKIFDPDAPQNFQSKVRSSIVENRENIKAMIDGEGIKNLASSLTIKDFELELEGFELYELNEIMDEANTLAQAAASGTQVAAVTVLTVVFAATYAVAAVNLIAGLNVAIAINLATEIVVTGPRPGPKPGPKPGPTPPRDGLALNGYIQAMENPYLQGLLALDEKTKQDLVNASRAGFISNHPEHAVQLLNDFVETECRTVLEVMSGEGLIELPSQNEIREKVLSLAGKVAARGMRGALGSSS